MEEFDSKSPAERNDWHRMKRVACNEYFGIDWDGLEWVKWKQIKQRNGNGLADRDWNGISECNGIVQNKMEVERNRRECNGMNGIEWCDIDGMNGWYGGTRGL